MGETQCFSIQTDWGPFVICSTDKRFEANSFLRYGINSCTFASHDYFLGRFQIKCSFSDADDSLRAVQAFSILSVLAMVAGVVASALLTLNKIPGSVAAIAYIASGK